MLLASHTSPPGSKAAVPRPPSEYAIEMMKLESPSQTSNTTEQLDTWRRQINSIPSLRGGKSVLVPLVMSLVEQIGHATITNLDSVPSIPPAVFRIEPRRGGAEPSRTPSTWREYLPFLRGTGLVLHGWDSTRLSSTGQELLADPNALVLARILADRIRLFAETLAVFSDGATTLEDVHDRIQTAYHPSGKSLSNTRTRTDWQEKLGLITPLANRLWAITEAGEALLMNRVIVTPEALQSPEDASAHLIPPPPEIATVLDELRDSTRSHESRSTRNIWVSSPHTSPNKVESLKTIINAAATRIERAELLSFVAQEFQQKHSSVQSSLPFIRGAGLLEEVGRGIFQATPAALAWLESEDDLNFIRILHAHMRFVGEMIHAVESECPRNFVYKTGMRYGLNTDRCRYIASFLISTGLVEEPKYLRLRATARGLSLARELPLAGIPDAIEAYPPQQATVDEKRPMTEETLRERLIRLAEEPQYHEHNLGRAFESVVEETFREMGFQTRLAGGSGNADVLVSWKDENGRKTSAIVEAKMRANGQISHTDISDVALENHKTLNSAAFVGIVGPAFSGETIRNMADQRGWALIDAARLGALVESVVALGIHPYEAAVLFASPDGIVELESIINDKKRALDIVSFVFATLREEREIGGDSISARDISREGRRTELSPSIPEVQAAIKLISNLPGGALRKIDDSERPEYVTYDSGDPKTAARQLRALANAIEKNVMALESS